MGNGGPYGSGPKPEQIVALQTVEEVNKWLKERSGSVDILQRNVLDRSVVLATNGKAYAYFIIWYRERE